MKNSEKLNSLEKFLQEENLKEKKAEIDKKEAEKIVEKEIHFIPLLNLFLKLKIDKDKHEDLHDLIFDRMIIVLSKELESFPAPDWFFEIIEGKLEVPNVLNTEIALQAFRIYLSGLEKEFQEKYYEK